MIRDEKNFGFPFGIDINGGTDEQTGDDAIKAKIIQVLFTSPGERVNQPEFGCGLLAQVFDANDQIRAAALEFTIGQSLVRWLEKEITVNQINVTSQEEQMLVELVYTRKEDLRDQALRIRFK